MNKPKYNELECLRGFFAASDRMESMIVCLCGSTRFWDDFQQVAAELTLMGIVVLTVHVPSSTTLGDAIPDMCVKARLNALHRRKIDMADIVLVLDVGGYVGLGTKDEIAYASRMHTPVYYLSAERAE